MPEANAAEAFKVLDSGLGQLRKDRIWRRRITDHGRRNSDGMYVRILNVDLIPPLSPIDRRASDEDSWNAGLHRAGVVQDGLVWADQFASERFKDGPIRFKADLKQDVVDSFFESDTVGQSLQRDRVRANGQDPSPKSGGDQT